MSKQDSTTNWRELSPAELRELILNQFFVNAQNQENCSDERISRQLRIPFSIVSGELSAHFDELKSKIDKRHYDDIDWGDL